MTANSNPTAIALIADMISETEAQIKLVESILANELFTMQRRVADAQTELEGGLHISETGIDQTSSKITAAVTKRASLYSNLSALRHTMKAAGGDPDYATAGDEMPGI